MKPIDSLSDDELARLVKRAAALPDASPAMLAAAFGLWPPARRATELRDAARAAVKLIVAVLSFDSWAQPAVATGLRAVASDTRHLLFSAKGRDIDLRINASAGRYALSGQVLGPDEAGRVVLSAHPVEASSPGQVRETSLDALGEFRLDGVQRGTYRMTLRMAGDDIVLPPIDVGEPIP